MPDIIFFLFLCFYGGLHKWKKMVKYWNNSINSKSLQFKNGLEMVYCIFFCFYCVDFKRKTQQKHNIAKLVVVFE